MFDCWPRVVHRLSLLWPRKGGLFKGGAYSTTLRSVPMPSTVASTTSPFFSQVGGVMNMPTPEGVPVEMTSPASSGKAALMYSIRVGTSKIRSLVFDFCRGSPLTLQEMTAFEQSNSSPVTTLGPMGQKVSRLLPRNHCLSPRWRSRAVTSLTTV